MEHPDHQDLTVNRYQWQAQVFQPTEHDPVCDHCYLLLLLCILCKFSYFSCHQISLQCHSEAAAASNLSCSMSFLSLPCIHNNQQINTLFLTWWVNNAHHEVLLFFFSLESSVSKFRRSIDKLQFYLFTSLSTSVLDKRLDGGRIIKQVVSSSDKHTLRKVMALFFGPMTAPLSMIKSCFTSP